ncbi:MAG: ABC transporter ATP-binding protein, partial [Paraglaciecola sp.]|nr:ABC transporter ATP-binding protein [Paraglaciecola sp.]
KAQGTPVIFSTHHLDEVDELCDKVVVIDKGRTMFDGETAAFRALADGSLHQAFMASISQSTAQV